MFEQPSKALMVALRAFVFRHEIFVEAREFEDGFIFVRQPKGRRRGSVRAGTSRYSFAATSAEPISYEELLQLVRRHRRTLRPQPANQRLKAGPARGRS
jgi:hypothetical protein